MSSNRFGGFRYIYSKAAKRDLKKFDRQVVEKLTSKLDALVSGKEGLDIEMMTGFTPPRYRLRAGDYRIVFEERRNEIVIIVIGVGHRKEIYKKMR